MGRRTRRELNRARNRAQVPAGGYSQRLTRVKLAARELFRKGDITELNIKEAAKKHDVSRKELLKYLEEQ
ncbi:MAG: hypothetical protein ABIH20_03745 [Candidatus Diapherotrites archaeon]